MSHNIEVVEIYVGEDLEAVEVHFNFYPGSAQIIGSIPELSDCGEPEIYEIEKALIDGITEIEITDDIEQLIIDELEKVRA